VRLCTYLDSHGPRAGLVEDGVVRPLEEPDLLALVRGGAPARAAQDGAPVPLSQARLLAPLRPGTLIGVGLNYRDHAAETGAALPAEPLLFPKLTSAVTAPGGPVARPAYTEELDYEGELAVVIGRRAANVTAADALGHVFGYAIMDDITARDRQRAEPQWLRAKSGDGFAPFGPWITTADEVADPQNLRITTHVNGELRQDSSTSDMIFGPQALVDFISETCTLEAGDLILTGTPSGVGMSMDPRQFLSSGDVVRIEIEALGHIEHAIA
jgi:2-keto-4-pentenoate hydratase/2-oxohepta-3-ene-1,7-dioic acid hydratase in catechol pathway